MTDQRRLEPEAALAIGSFIVFAAALGAVVWRIVPAENEKYVMLMLGALIGLVKDTFARYFSSTKGAQDQRKDAAEVAKALAEKVAPITTEALPVTVINTPDQPVPTEAQ